jgi:hypothetical protein
MGSLYFLLTRRMYHLLVSSVHNPFTQGRAGKHPFFLDPHLGFSLRLLSSLFVSATGVHNIGPSRRRDDRQVPQIRLSTRDWRKGRTVDRVLLFLSPAFQPGIV